MLFTSLQYLLFLPIVVFLYWLLPSKLRLPMLLVASYLFYMSWIPQFILLILFMTLFNWIYGKYLYKAQSSRKLILGIGITVNLVILGIFKYANFFLSSLNWFTSLTAHYHADLVINIILPLGISFFTFEFIHYLFEIYRGNKPIDSFVLFALFAAFFPTQIAGPIKRYPDFVAQMLTKNSLKLSYFDEGLPLIIIGLAKKLLFANTLAIFVDMGLSDPAAYGTLELWLFAWAFAFQIYFDFSGYTDIARGSAMLFGYHIPINFNMPYIAKNIADFWHRWHISLSTWLRDYLFIPLGGSRCSHLRVNLNLFITMALGGLWHGASWNFVFWGVYHGLCLIIHREFLSLKNNNAMIAKIVDSKLGQLFSIILTFNIVTIGWVFFRVHDFSQAVFIAKRMILFHPIFSRIEAGHFLVLKSDLPLIVPVAIAMTLLFLLLNLPVSALNEKHVFKKLPSFAKAVFCSATLIILITFAQDNSQPFIYFQF